MPNWCNNIMTISHEDPAMVQKAADAWNSGKFLATMIPEPDYTTTPVKLAHPEISEKFAKTDAEREAALRNEPTIREDSWWDWRVLNWGTKWDVGKVSEHDNDAEINGNEFTVYFDSAWSPPCGAYEKLTDMGYDIRAYYLEHGCAFVGYWAYGRDDCYELPSDPQEIQDTLPNHIIDTWDLVSQAEEWLEMTKN